MNLTALLLLFLPLLTLAQNATTPTNTTTLAPTRTPRPPPTTNKGLYALPPACKSLLLSSTTTSKLATSCTPTLLSPGRHNPDLTLQCSSRSFSPKISDIKDALSALPSPKVAPAPFLGGDGCSVLSSSGGTKVKMCIIGSSLPSRVDMDPRTRDGGGRWVLDSVVVEKVVEVVMRECVLGEGNGARAEGWVTWGDVAVGVVEEPEGKRMRVWTEEDQRKYEMGVRLGEMEEDEGVKADIEPEKESKKKVSERKEEGKTEGETEEKKNEVKE